MTEDPEETEAPPAEEPAVPVEEREDIEVQAMKDRFVKLISAEGHVFHVDRDAATVSSTVQTMLSGNFAEASGEIRFPEISTPVLEKVIQYCYYKRRFENSGVPVPEFPIEPEVALELLMAANYLDC